MLSSKTIKILGTTGVLSVKVAATDMRILQGVSSLGV